MQINDFALVEIDLIIGLREYFRFKAARE